MHLKTGLLGFMKIKHFIYNRSHNTTRDAETAAVRISVPSISSISISSVTMRGAQIRTAQRY
jgi:hypothetical protein